MIGVLHQASFPFQKKKARHDRFLKRRLMNITVPTIKPIQVANECEGEHIEDRCSVDSESVSKLSCLTLAIDSEYSVYALAYHRYSQYIRGIETSPVCPAKAVPLFASKKLK